MDQKVPKVSVVIPCYNDKDYIKETVTSVLNQKFTNLEIIIVDDGSDKETQQVLKKLKQPNLKIITQKNGGLSNARNNGIKNAKGEYILSIDSDDTLDTSFLLKAVKILNHNTHISAVSSYVNIFEGNYKIISIHRPKGGTLKNFLFDNNSTSFALIRKSVWKEVGGFDEKMKKGFEDWEFWISVTRNGGFIHVIPEFLFNYRYKKVSMSKDSKQNYREKNLSYIYKKHQDIYKNHFEEVVDFISELAIRHKRNEIKYKTSLDFKIGRIILFPIRTLKKMFIPKSVFKK